MKKKTSFIPGIVLAAVSIVFTVCAALVDVQPIGPEGTDVGFAALNKACNIFPFNAFWLGVSDGLGIAALATAAAFGFWWLIKGFFGKDAVVGRNIFPLCLMYVALLILYILFIKKPVNFRPVIMPGEIMPEPSYPSSHTLLAVSVFGTAIIALNNTFANKKLRIGLSIACCALLVLGVLSRIRAGVHWCTDIIGGILIALTLVCFYGAAVTADKPKR